MEQDNIKVGLEQAARFERGDTPKGTIVTFSSPNGFLIAASLKFGPGRYRIEKIAEADA